MAASDKNWVRTIVRCEKLLLTAQAQAYINEPLTAPDPSDETGLGTSFCPPSEATTNRPTTPQSREPRKLSKTNPFHNRGSPKQTSSTTRELKPAFKESYPTPPSSTSPHPQASPKHRQEFLNQTTRPRRSSSLNERFPGDPSVSPLNQLAKEKAKADRARHITKNHAIRPDTIDSLDASGLASYHHEGPYDATLFARNNSWKSSPVAAVAESNKEALKATPREKIIDSIQGHRPLDGVAAYPPGTQDRNGHMYRYQEGENMMIDENAGGGPYKRWPGVQYHPDDIKGKGEPSYTIEKALKEQSLSEKDQGQGLELKSDANRRRSNSAAYRSEAFSGDNDGLARSGSLSNRLKKRVGSLRKRD